MTRLAISLFGTGYLLGVATVAVFGTLTSLSLGFLSGMAFTLCVEACVGWGLYVVGKKWGWISSTLTEPRNDRTVEL